MPDLILHHYATSPFSEKMRLILGYKKLAWKSVTVPSIMPKPDVTGADRRLPQDAVPADRLAHLLRHRADLRRAGAHAAHARAVPGRAQGPGARGGAMGRRERCSGPPWPTTSTRAAWPRCLAARPTRRPNSGPAWPRPSAKTARKMRTGMPRLPLADATAAYRSYLRRLSNMLDGQPYLLGTTPCVADFAAYHPLWFTRTQTPVMAESWTPHRPCWPGWTAWPPSATAGSEKLSADSHRLCAHRRGLARLLTMKHLPGRSRHCAGQQVTITARVSAPSRPRASWWPPPACTTRCAAPTNARAWCMCTFPRIGYDPQERQKHDHGFQGQDGSSHRRRLRLRAGVRAHRRRTRHEPGAGRRAAGRAGPGRRRDAAAGAPVLARKVDVSSADQMEALAAAVKERFGAPHFVFNNAGVAPAA
jgi:glutathione S-transferase